MASDFPRSLLACAVGASFVVSAVPASAAMIFDLGASVSNTAQDDVNPVNITPSTPIVLFGVSQTQLRVGSNGGYGVPGGLSGTQYDNSQSPWYNVSSPKIAVLWDDLNTAPNSAPQTGVYAGTSKIGGTTYTDSYSITVPAAFSYGTGHAFTTEIAYQASFFTGAVTVTLNNGDVFNFLAGDIAFSYGANALVAFAGNQAAVGLADGAGNVVGMPGTTNGVLPTADRALLPTGEYFVLFRVNGSSYDATIETFAPLPEPGTAILLSLGATALLRRRR